MNPLQLYFIGGEEMKIIKINDIPKEPYITPVYRAECNNPASRD
jgi:hypothetical protein